MKAYRMGAEAGFDPMRRRILDITKCNIMMFLVEKIA